MNMCASTGFLALLRIVIVSLSTLPGIPSVDPGQ